MKALRSLIWKETSEQAWKLLLGCIVLGTFALIGLRTRIIPDEEMLVWICYPAAALLPLLASTGLVPAERDAGTFEALAALPVPPRTVLAVKTVVGLLLTVVPLGVALVVSLAVAGGREMGDAAMIGMFTRSALSAVAIFFWMLAGAIRLPSESRAALTAVGLLLFWGMAWVGMAQLDLGLLSTISPVSFIFGRSSEPHWTPPSMIATLAVEGLIAIALWLWAARAIASPAGRGD